MQDDLQIVWIADTKSRSNWRRQRHDGGAPDIDELFGHDGIGTRYPQSVQPENHHGNGQGADHR